VSLDLRTQDGFPAGPGAASVGGHANTLARYFNIFKKMK
jgi:hypothetical protein